MNTITNFTAPFWVMLNYPIIVLGKSSITLWVIVLNLIFILFFLFISGKLKTWLLNSLAQKQGIDVSNWRAAITLGYYAFLAIGLIEILQSTGLDLSLFTVLIGVIGTGVGFGMQTIFSNFISAVIILLEKPLKLGDRIEVGEISGNVPFPEVRLTEFGENGLKFSLLECTQDYSDHASALKSLLNFNVLRLFREKSIHMPFPQREIHIHNQPAKSGL